MKVLVIGSGPIIIGQAAEFDYAGTQACRSLREEGCEVVLINSNPATIMTDPEMSDALYIEPLTPEFCERVIERERPDALLPTLGGQTALNLAVELQNRGTLERFKVRVLGTPLASIRKAEDREEFRALMRAIGEPVPESFIAESPQDLKQLLGEKVPDVDGRLIEFPYPRIVRPAYTLGGTGGGIAHNAEELWEIGLRGLKLSMRSQIMVERSLLGWKEIEYEVMRDRVGNCITVCNMENLDPMGVHTGDSIVVAPSQTLSDLEPEDYPRPRHRGRLQRAARREPGELRLLRHRSEPARLSIVCLGLQGDRVSHCASRREDRGRQDPGRDREPSDQDDEGLLRAGSRLHRGQDAPMAVRQVPNRRSAIDDADESHR
jgi:hypothetical protein